MTGFTPLLVPEADSGFAQRAEPRSNMFVTATLHLDGRSSPVRVRNMSRTGALVEVDAIPPERSRVRLERGSLSVRGEIVWRGENRAGIRFDAAVEVGNWLPSGSRPSHQQRVDEMIQACRDAPAGGMGPAVVPATGQAGTIHQLADLRDTLNAVAEELAGDTSIAMAHATALQKIDVAAQALGKLSALLARPA